jgi:cell division protein FtsW
VRRLALVVFCGSLALRGDGGDLFVIGAEIKGATRWISVAGCLAPAVGIPEACLAVSAAWMCSLQKAAGGGDSRLSSGHGAISAAVAGVLLNAAGPRHDHRRHRDRLAAQFFIAGLPMVLIAAGRAAFVGGLVGAYFMLPHVHQRIDQFLDPASGDTYQIDRALEAFQNGGLFGRGPGEGHGEGWCCPTPMPTSSSPSRARNSA